MGEKKGTAQGIPSENLAGKWKIALQPLLRVVESGNSSRKKLRKSAPRAQKNLILPWGAPVKKDDSHCNFDKL